MSDLVGNPKHRFSHDAAHMFQYQYDRSELEEEMEIVRSLWNTVLSMVQQSGVERKQANGK